MCILDSEESEVTNDGTQALWEMTRTAVIRGLITSCDGSFLIFHKNMDVILSERQRVEGSSHLRNICSQIGAKILRLRASPSAQDDIPGLKKRRLSPALSFFHYRHRPVMAARTSISMDCIFLWVARPLSISTWVKPPSWVQTMRLVRPSVSSSTAM